MGTSIWKGRGSDQKPDFLVETDATIRRLQAALIGVIDFIPAAEQLARATDLQRVLGLYPRLAWQIFRVARAANPIDEARAIPGSISMDRFLTAAQERGVADTRIHEARHAYEAFEQLVNVHAGTRPAFDTMIGGLTTAGAAQLDLEHRRAISKGYAHFLGARAKCCYECYICRPNSNNPDVFDVVTLTGFIGLSTQRCEGAWEILAVQGDASFIDDAVAELESQPVPMYNGRPLLNTTFSSHPLPSLKLVRSGEGLLSVLVQGQLIAHSSAIDLLMGPIPQKGSFGRYRTPEKSTLNSRSSIRTPYELYYLDVLIQRGVYPPKLPPVKMWNLLRTETKLPPEYDCLPVHEKVVYRSRWPEGLDIDEVPRYREIVFSALKESGWENDVFDIYRFRIEYPLIPSLISIQFDLPEK